MNGFQTFVSSFNFRSHFFQQVIFEGKLLKQHWLTIVGCLLFQFVHGVFTNLAYFLHRPSPLLFDIGYELVPEVGVELQWLSEILFLCMWGAGLFVILTPLFRPSPYSSVLMFRRIFFVCFLAQCLRCATFIVTVLPSPNYHCRIGYADYNPPRDLHDILFKVANGCGDLVFSGHTLMACILTLVAYEYGDHTAFTGIRKLVWMMLGIQAVLILSARKHYTIDILVAIYTVPSVWYIYKVLYPDSCFGPSPALAKPKPNVTQTVLPTASLASSSKVKIDDHDHEV
eukprot:GCRY01000753.1.p1 GENE.GCRY01000753.1~~GCRY01000753.1.p1  ORF type:complete len:285 (+),score=41.96 GCRY01000753.1:211-1065(+)